MAKYDLNKVISDTHKLYDKKSNRGGSIGIGTNLKSLKDGNFLEMPQWWKDATNTKGLPFGGYVMLAGTSDSGKTSAAITAMKAAQEQDMAVIYIETENKTTSEDLVNWGVDLTQIMIIKSAIAEVIYDDLFNLWDSFMKNNPDGRLLVVIDSVGNVVSKRDMDTSMVESNQKPGGKGKSNREGINKLIARLTTANATALIINYTYDNMGSPGKTNAGGNALNLFSSMTYQTSRAGWVEKTVKGQKVRIGAKVQWRLFKNHIDKSNPGPKSVELEITAEGIKVLGAKDE